MLHQHHICPRHAFQLDALSQAISLQDHFHETSMSNSITVTAKQHAFLHGAPYQPIWIYS